MKRTLQTGFIISLAAFCALAVTPQAKAADNTLRDYNNATWLSVGADSFGYKESTPAPYLSDSERDWIPSAAAGVNYMKGDLNWYFALEGSISYGDAQYNGAYLFAPTTALEGTTKETISTVDGKIGKGFSLLDGELMLTPYVELGYRYWDRNLGGGQTEDYSNFDVLGGAMVQAQITDGVVATIYGSGGTTFDPQMKSAGDTFDLASEAMYKAGGKIGYEFTPRLELFTAIDYEHLSYGQSPVQADGFYEPDSKTNETAVRIGIAYHMQ